MIANRWQHLFGVGVSADPAAMGWKELIRNAFGALVSECPPDLIKLLP